VTAADDRIVAERDLPAELALPNAVEVAYPSELAAIEEALLRRLPILVECEKELTPYIYRVVRDRLKAKGLRCVYLDGRPTGESNGPPVGVIGTMMNGIRDAVRGPIGERVVVLPHLDLLTTGSSGALTTEAKEVIPLLYENPEVLWLGFKDPTFTVPKVIEQLFPRHVTFGGVSRDRLRHVVTQREARKLGNGFDPYALYRYVSGVNVVRLRRLLGTLDGEDYPADPRKALSLLRAATVGPTLTLPEVDLQRDIGGYKRVKERLEREILSVMAHKDSLTNQEAMRQVETLIPRGMIFWGPPGTGKTLFAKAMATALGAAITIVSGPELKSRWVGESEENIRQIFVRARQSAPAIIVFDELDSFAAERGTYTGSGVEHSMVNQLLTEMDGFRNDELVFVVGTTNFVESLDAALLRPGRFEFHLEIPYPNADDRREIFEVHNRRLGLGMTDRAREFAVKRSGDPVEGLGGRYAGDHIQALCRQIARSRLRSNLGTGSALKATEAEDVENALTMYRELPALTRAEERVIATHEAGHAVVALHCPETPPIDRISIRGDLPGALGIVQYGERAHRFVTTHAQMEASMAVLFGGREAEALLCDNLSIGCSGDLERATAIARLLVEVLDENSLPGEDDQRALLSEATREAIDRRIVEALGRARDRAAEIISDHEDEVKALRDLLLEKKVLDREALAPVFQAAADNRSDPGDGEEEGR